MKTSNEQYAVERIRSLRVPYLYIRSIIANWRRDRKNRKVAKYFKKRRTVPYLDHGYRVITPSNKFNGLGRAYSYEIERLKSEGLLNPLSRNVLILGQPRHYWKIFRKDVSDLDETYRIGLWVTEFDVMPPDWMFAVDMINEIWTPSAFSADALKVTGLPVTVRPHAVKVTDGPVFQRSHFGVSNGSFLGLAIMDLGTCPDRKNPYAHIRAWQIAFGSDPDAVLLIKVRLGKRANFVMNQLNEAIGKSKNIKIIKAEFDDEEMAAFQRMADVYLSLHRSEGYGLNIHEMLERGKSVIATGYSGNMTFMRSYPNAKIVPYQLSPYHDVTFHYRGGSLQWANADLIAAAKILTELRNKKFI